MYPSIKHGRRHEFRTVGASSRWSDFVAEFLIYRVLEAGEELQKPSVCRWHSTYVTIGLFCLISFSWHNFWFVWTHLPDFSSTWLLWPIRPTSISRIHSIRPFSLTVEGASKYPRNGHSLVFRNKLQRYFGRFFSINDGSLLVIFLGFFRPLETFFSQIDDMNSTECLP